MIEIAKKHVKAEQLSRSDGIRQEKPVDLEKDGAKVALGDGKDEEKQHIHGEEDEELEREAMQIRRKRAEKMLKFLEAR